MSFVDTRLPNAAERHALMAGNLHNVDALAGFCHADGLSKKKFSFDDLFASVSQGRKRGDEFRF